MGLYENKVLPHLINLACGGDDVAQQRARVVPQATGRVLEVGMGSGLNLPFYDPDQVDFIWGLEPSDGMRRKAAPAIERSEIDVEWLGLPGEEIPLDDNSADSIVITYTLCSIADWRAALGQMRRVLKPDGKVYFCEHGEAPDDSILKWQRRLNPVWKRLAGGCHLDRPIVANLEEAGFTIDTVDTGYRGSPKAATFDYCGVASIS